MFSKKEKVLRTGLRSTHVVDVVDVEYKICANPKCAKRFDPDNPAQKYCNRKCSESFRNKKKIVKRQNERLQFPSE